MRRKSVVSSNSSTQSIWAKVTVIAEGFAPLQFTLPISFGSKWFRISIPYGELTNEYNVAIMNIHPLLWWAASPVIAWVSILFKGSIPAISRDLRVKRSEEEHLIVFAPRWPNDLAIEMAFASARDLERFLQTVVAG